VLELLSSLLIEAAAGLLLNLGSKGLATAREESRLRELFRRKAAAEKAIAQALSEFTSNSKLGAASQEFLKSPEAASCVRRLFATKLRPGGGMTVAGVKREFISLFSLRTGLDRVELAPAAGHIFDLVVAGVEDVIDRGIANGSIPALAARSAAQTRLVLDAVADISTNLELLRTKKLSVEDILSFEESYRQQVSVRHAHIIPPHVDVVRKIRINQLFVPSSFLSDENGLDGTFGISELLAVAHRAVILGNPGGGKSTFALKVCHDLASRYDRRLFNGRFLTPVLVILREYGSVKQDSPCSILDFIKSRAASRYQIEPPDSAFEYLLHNGRLLVMFDGLDELLDTTYRREISGDVEAFCAKYATTPVLVTSRAVGYREAPLDEEVFRTFRLTEFGDRQVETYAQKWFAVADRDLSKDERVEKVSGFVHESRVVPDLRSNPLMLALMCNIYRGAGYIPKNRPDVYARCATMLFERWDSERGIQAALPFERQLRPTLHYLAHWIYSDQRLGTGVTERQLVREASRYLCPRRFEDPDDARAAAEAFISFCRGRAWVFTDIGTTPDGERLYQFTHRTFLEYFTAAYLVRTQRRPEELAKLLLPKIASGEWDVVAQLAFQLQSEDEDAADELLELLLQAVEEAEDQRAATLLSFAARSLEFLVPSPRVVRGITEACLAASLAVGRVERDDPRVREQFFGPIEPPGLVGSLITCGHENRPIRNQGCRT
jgi:NACHT domain